MKYITTIGDRQFLVEIIDDRHVSVDGKVYEVDFESVSGQPVYSLIVDGKSHESYVAQVDDIWQVLMRGRLYPVSVEDEREQRQDDEYEDEGEIQRGDLVLLEPEIKPMVPKSLYNNMREQIKLSRFRGFEVYFVRV